MQIEVADLPLWLPLGFEAQWPQPLGKLPAVDVAALLARAPAEAERDEALRASVRQMLRAGGHRPSGRGKPASEYLVRSVEQGGLPEINPAVDLLNAVSFHSGIPISVIDLALASGPYSVRTCEPGEEYVFNPSGQTLSLKGLLCLCDGTGPCANAVKDCQRTKTSDGTTRSFHILWAPREFEAKSRAAFEWYLQESRALGAEVAPWDPSVTS